MFIFRKSLFSIVRPVIVNVEAGVEAEEEVVVEAEVAVERVVALLLDCATQVLKPLPHLPFEAKQCLPSSYMIIVQTYLSNASTSEILQYDCTVTSLKFGRTLKFVQRFHFFLPRLFGLINWVQF